MSASDTIRTTTRGRIVDDGPDAAPQSVSAAFEAEIPHGYIALGYVAVIKCLDADGHAVLIHAESEDISIWEAAGMVRAATIRTEAVLHDAACYVDSDDEDDEG